MSFANRYNKGSKFNIDTAGYEYHSLKELAEMTGDSKDCIFVLDGLYINNKSLYGPAPAAILKAPACIVNLPDHLVNDIRDMLGDDEAIDAIKAGKAGFKIRQYEDKKYHKKCYGVTWVDC